jgi:hypothetical protein
MLTGELLDWACQSLGRKLGPVLTKKIEGHGNFVVHSNKMRNIVKVCMCEYVCEYVRVCDGM